MMPYPLGYDRSQWKDPTDVGTSQTVKTLLGIFGIITAFSLFYLMIVMLRRRLTGRGLTIVDDGPHLFEEDVVFDSIGHPSASGFGDIPTRPSASGLGGRMADIDIPKYPRRRTQPRPYAQRTNTGFYGRMSSYP